MIIGIRHLLFFLVFLGLLRAEPTPDYDNLLGLSLTRQLRDYLDYAEAEGMTFHLYVRKDTKLSSTLLKLKEEGKIKIFEVIEP